MIITDKEEIKALEHAVAKINLVEASSVKIRNAYWHKLYNYYTVAYRIDSKRQSKTSICIVDKGKRLKTAHEAVKNCTSIW